MKTQIRDRFLKVESRNRGENSCKAYLTSINGFYKEISEIKNKEYENDLDLIEDVTFMDFEEYFERLTERNKKSTANLRLNSLRKLFNYAKEAEIITKDPTKTTKSFHSSKINKEKIVKEVLSISEIKKILNCSYIRGKAEKNFEWNSCRDRCLIAILATSGIRISEALAIQMIDIEKTELGYVINICEENVKNNIAKRVPVTEGIEIYFKEYYNALMVEGHKEGYLFFTKSGNKLCYTDAEKIINKLIKKANIEKKITAHSFRHTLTQILLRKDVNEATIYKILGWSDQKMIGVYKGAENLREDDELKFKHCNILG